MSKAPGFQVENVTKFHASPAESRRCLSSHIFLVVTKCPCPFPPARNKPRQSKDCCSFSTRSVSTEASFGNDTSKTPPRLGLNSILWYTVRWYTLLHYVIFTILCYAVLYSIPYHTIPFHTVPYYTTRPRYVVLYYKPY